MDDDLKTEVKGQILAVKDLPTLPHVLDEVSKLVEDPESSTDQIAKCIDKDLVLSAKVLKMVNSPVYGFPGRIGTVQHSLVLLGFNVIRGIIISTSVFDIMVQAMQGLWEHSLGCATACSIIARRVGFEDPEEFAVGGLLHDLGKVVAAVQLPGLHDRVVETVAGADVDYITAEREVMGFGHDRINAWVGRHWNLPGTVRDAMSHHHNPEGAPNWKEHAAVAHVGDFMVRAFEFGHPGDDHIVPLSPAAVNLLKLKTRDLESIMDELSEQFLDIAEVTF